MSGHNGQQTGGSRVARLVQVTDCHLGPTDEYCLAGVRTLNSFREVLARVADDRDRPDLVVASGDIAAHGSVEAYRRFIAAMASTSLPYIWLPGNHDDFDLMLEGLPVSPYCPVFDRAGWRLLSINTATPGRVEGRLSDAELEFIAASLEQERDAFIAVFMHHPPMAVGCDWLDRQQVVNGGELARLLDGHPNVRAIFTGHVHQKGSLDFHGVPLHTTPSTCFQFTPGRRDFAVDTLPPAYRWIDLYDDGRVDTDVVWIEDSAEVVDPDVDGY